MKRFLSFHRHRLLAAVLLVTVASTLHAQTITTFDIPNSISINPAAINSAGQVVGWYTDAVGDHGFLRSRNGAISSIDVVGATSTRATAINPAGRIVGYSYGPLHQIDEWRWDVIRGFAREINGTINIFDACSVVGPIPQANMTYPQNISPSGEITGLCNVSEGIDEQEFGFVRQADGSTVWVGYPAKPTFTKPQAINPKGQITGRYFPGGCSELGFLLQPDGTFITFSASGPIDNCSPPDFTEPQAINPPGDITGSFHDLFGTTNVGFLRKRDGTTTQFNVGSIATIPQAISPEGKIAGTYLDGNYQYHGFLRERDGNFLTFDVPNSTNTFPTSISSSGVIAGWYSDASGVHGFVREK